MGQPVVVVNTRPQKLRKTHEDRGSVQSPSCSFTNSVPYSSTSLRCSLWNLNLGSSRVGIELRVRSGLSDIFFEYERKLTRPFVVRRSTPNSKSPFDSYSQSWLQFKVMIGIIAAGSGTLVLVSKGSKSRKREL